VIEKHHLSDLAEAIEKLADATKEQTKWFKSHLDCITKIDLKKAVDEIMSAISEFAAKQDAFNSRVDAAIVGLTGDVQTLNDKITELQNSAGQITPEDQALLDAIQARSEVIAAKLEALDALTPPKPPVG